MACRGNEKIEVEGTAGDKYDGGADYDGLKIGGVISKNCQMILPVTTFEHLI